jgi:hypothetical protein
MNLNDLNSCFDNAAPTSGQKQKMLKVILERENENVGAKVMKLWTKKMTAAMAAAVALLLMATTTLAVGLGWHVRFIEFFGVGENQAALLDGAVGSPNISITENGITVEVLHTLVDSQGVYVIFEVTVSENVELNDGIVFERCVFTANTAQLVGGYVTAVDYVDILDRNGNKITGVASFIPSEQVTDGILRLELCNLGYRDWPGNPNHGGSNPFVTLVEGQWLLKWNFTYCDTTKKVMPNVAMGTDNDFMLTEIAISPVSITVRAHRELSSSMIGLLGDDGAVTVTFKDGSTIEYRAMDRNSLFGCTLINEEKMIYQFRMYNRFDKIIDPDDVVSVTLSDVPIPIK